jgi:hypothetical protein
MKVFDVPTPEELIQKLYSDRLTREGIRNHCKHNNKGIGV